MERRVLISYASEDPDWTPEQVEAVATAIEQTGLRVHLDRWHQRDRKRRLSLAEWQAWMDASIEEATHIICLVSARYRELWSRKQGVPGGYGVAFESIRLIHHLYLLKQHNDGRILTLRPDGHGYDHIPRDLALDCPDYCWVSHRDILLSHLGEAALPGEVGGVDAAAPVAASVPVAAKAPVPPQMADTPARPAPTPALVQPPLPAWASASGNDKYGHWADLIVKDVTQRMRWIAPSGSAGFVMGDEMVGRSLQIIETGFWLADTPCTQAFWQAVVGMNPSHFNAGIEAQGRPVETVSWDDVMGRFILHLGAYFRWWIGEKVCLPTEVEWEYAARAGTCTAYWWGTDWDARRGNANVTGERGWDDSEGTTPVKRYAPNPWGLYDVHGNVWEWCADQWEPRLGVSEAHSNEDSRVVRGGSWFNHPGRARAACRDALLRGDAYQSLGFRFALRSPAGPEAR